LNRCGCVARVSLANHLAGLVLTAISLTACFEVVSDGTAARPSAPLLIDDFRDGDQLPVSPLFAPWVCGTWPATSSVECDRSSSPDGDWAQSLHMSLQDPPDGILDYPSGFQEARLLVGTLDLSGYESVTLNAKFEPGDPAPPLPVELTLRVWCDALSTQLDGTWLQHTVGLGPNWQALIIPLAELRRPQYLSSFGRQECLRGVDAFWFQVMPALVDGQAALGTLSVDQVGLQ
jgi:hypothetical protein